MIFALFIAAAFAATYGVDYSSLVSVSSHQCFKNNGYTFAIPRCWCSVGSVDSNCVQNCKKAHSGGMSRVDTYFFPCYSCGNIAGQVSTFWNHVVANQMDFTRLWMDIEGTWSSSYSTNQNFFNTMMNQVNSIGIVNGVYCSSYYWSSFFGSGFTYSKASSTPLWYPHYDDWASFGDFSAFGGWSKPTIKQYQGNVNFCSAYVDKNYQA